MKLTVILLTVGFLNVSAKAISQNVTFSGERVPLKAVFSSVEKQTGFIFAYPKSALQASKPVSISANNVPLKKFLADLFDSQPMSFQIKGKNIFISSKSLAPTVVIAGDIPYSPIRGRVLDDDGQPLAGASVSVKNSKRVAVTDTGGQFTLNVNEGDIIVVSFVGYQSKDVKVTPSISTGNNSLVINLSKISTELDETVVIAYGTTTKRLRTGNVTTVKGKDIEDMPVNNPMLALQGRVPGLEITPANGVAGAGVKLRIQGVNSLQNGNDPLIIVDNIPYPSQNVAINGYSNIISTILGGSGGTSAGQMGSPLSNINTVDIESIEVLKGADATSIYGSRAANGAILITTKKGKAGKMLLNLNVQSGWQKIGRKLSVLTGNEYLAMRRQALENDDAPVGPRDYDLNGTFDTTIIHDWQKELLSKSALNTMANVRVSGGSEYVTYYLSGTYTKQQSVFPEFFHPIYNTRGYFSSNVSGTTPNKKLEIQFSSNYGLDLNKLPTADYMGIALNFIPVGVDLLTKEGRVNWLTDKNTNETLSNNPVINSLQTFNRKINTLLSSLSLSYTILPGLKISGNFGYNRIETENIGTVPTEAISPESRAQGQQNSLTVQNSVANTLNIEPMLKYSRSIKRAKIEALLGSTITNFEQLGRGYTASGFSNDLLIKDIASASRVSSMQSNNSIYKYCAIFGRINYNQDDKYIIQLTSRRDGSSRFGPENQFHTFGAISGAWIFSEEAFMKNRFKWLSYGKVRTSYGTSGNDQIGDYTFLALYTSPYVPRSYQGIPGLQSNGITNQYLQWENTKKIEVGLELGFANNDVTLAVNFAQNRSSNQLLDFSISSTAGFPFVKLNLPATVQNRIWEFMLNTKNIHSSHLTWTSSLTLTIPNNRLLSFPGIEESAYKYSYTVGRSISNQKLFKSAGVNSTTGIFQFYDNKGNIVSNPNPTEDAFEFRNTDPIFYGALVNNVAYKNITFSISLIFNNGNIKIPGLLPPGTKGQNVPSYYLNTWQKIGDNAEYQKYTASYHDYGNYLNYMTNSDKSYFNQYYIRCGNISLGYELSREWKRKIGVSAFNIYTQIMNPFLITNNDKVLDPQTGFSLPQLKIYNFGIKVTL